MDWIDILNLSIDNQNEFYFLVDREIKQGKYSEFPTATKFATLEVIF